MTSAVTRALRKRKVDIAMAETLLLSAEEGEQPTHLSLLSQLLHDLRLHHVKPQSRTDESLLRSLVECVKEAIRGALPLDVLEAMDEVEAPTAQMN